MHEAQEDAMEFDKENGPFSGLLALAAFFGIIYVISYLRDSHKDAKEQRKEYIQKKESSDYIAQKTITNNDISKYQHKESWQKGYKKATYDINYGSIKKLYGKTIDDLIYEYRQLCEKGHLVQADAIMEKIGYYQNIEFNNKRLISEGKEPIQYIV